MRFLNFEMLIFLKNLYYPTLSLLSRYQASKLVNVSQQL